MSKSYRERGQRPFQTRVLRERPGLLRIAAEGLEEAGYVPSDRVIVVPWATWKRMIVRRGG